MGDVIRANAKFALKRQRRYDWFADFGFGALLKTVDSLRPVRF